MKTPKVEILTCTTVRKTHTIKITGDQLLRMLGIKQTAGATVTIRVPEGGDWSNMYFDVDAENPVIVQWHEEKTLDE
jgi:hypothetical protein